MSEFKFFDRGCKSTTLFIPGWACDWRVFNTLSIKSNYLMPVEFSPFDFEKGFLDALRQNPIDKISIVGWSMGALLAGDLLARHKDIVNEAVLISVRKRYKKEDIENTRMHLKKNRVAFLYKFYKDCFSADEKEGYRWFRNHLLKDYLNLMGQEVLAEGLDYLSDREIGAKAVEGLRLKLVHGMDDKIAPIAEAMELKKDMHGADFITIDGCGHMPFLNPRFNSILNG